jgi:predicted negative regulator of RcsB-dependent stress response
MAVIGGRNVGTNDLVVMGAGGLLFIDSFLPWWGVSFKGLDGFGGASGSLSAWHFSGAWIPVLLVLAVAGLTAFRVFGGQSLPSVANGAVTWNFITTAVSALAAFIILIRWLTYPSFAHTNAGGRFGTYIGLALAIVQAVYGYMNISAAGERLPWQQQRTA